MVRKIAYEIVVNALVEEVWDAWTTAEGVRTFLAPQARIDLHIGGQYEILFNLDQPPGLQGTEGCTILSYLPVEMLSFTWNAPPEFIEIRPQLTWVVVQINPLPEELARVRLTHLGWGEGERWDEVYDYFSCAWDLVIKRLADRFVNGPRNWSGES